MINVHWTTKWVQRKDRERGNKQNLLSIVIDVGQSSKRGEVNESFNKITKPNTNWEKVKLKRK